MNFQVKEFVTILISVLNVSESRDWYKALFNLDPIEDNAGSFPINIRMLLQTPEFRRLARIQHLMDHDRCWNLSHLWDRCRQALLLGIIFTTITNLPIAIPNGSKQAIIFPIGNGFVKKENLSLG